MNKFFLKWIEDGERLRKILGLGRGDFMIQFNLNWNKEEADKKYNKWRWRK